MDPINDLYDAAKYFCQEHEIELKTKQTTSPNHLRFSAQKGPLSLFADISPTKERLQAKRMIRVIDDWFRESTVYFKRDDDHTDYSTQVWVVNTAVADYANQLGRSLREEVDENNFDSFILVSEIYDQLRNYYNDHKREIIKYPETQFYIYGKERTPALECLLLLASFYPWSSNK